MIHAAEKRRAKPDRREAETIIPLASKHIALVAKAARRPGAKRPTTMMAQYVRREETFLRRAKLRLRPGNGDTGGRQAGRALGLIVAQPVAQRETGGDFRRVNGGKDEGAAEGRGERDGK